MRANQPFTSGVTQSNELRFSVSGAKEEIRHALHMCVYVYEDVFGIANSLSLSLSKEHNPGPNELSPRAMTQKSRTGKGASAVAMSFTITKLSLLPRSDL